MQNFSMFREGQNQQQMGGIPGSNNDMSAMLNYDYSNNINAQPFYPKGYQDKTNNILTSHQTSERRQRAHQIPVPVPIPIMSQLVKKNKQNLQKKHAEEKAQALKP
jgi:hypothetical protein